MFDYDKEINDLIKDDDTSSTPIQTLSSLESTIDNACKEIDNMLKDNDVTVANESVTKLLERAKINIDKCSSLEACNGMKDKIVTEAVSFNNCLNTMAQAGRELKDGSIDKTAFKEKIQPCVTELQSKCGIISTVNESYTNELTDDNLLIVRDFIIGVESLVNDKIESFTTPTKDENTTLESFISSCENMTITEESISVSIDAIKLMKEYKKKLKELTEDIRDGLKTKNEQSLKKDITEYIKLCTEIKEKMSALEENTFQKVVAIIGNVFLFWDRLLLKYLSKSEYDEKLNKPFTTNYQKAAYITELNARIYGGKKLLRKLEKGILFKQNDLTVKVSKESATNLSSFIASLECDCNENTGDSTDDDEIDPDDELLLSSIDLTDTDDEDDE